MEEERTKFHQVLSFLIQSDNNFSSFRRNVDLSLSPEILVLLMLTLKDLQQMVSRSVVSVAGDRWVVVNYGAGLDVSFQIMRCCENNERDCFQQMVVG